MPSDANGLIQRDSRPISGWAVLLFLAVLTVLVVVVSLLLPGHGKLMAIGLLYGVGLVSMIVAVAPMGWPALPALAIHGAGWRPIVFGPLATLALSVAVSQIGPEVQGMKEVEELVREPRALVVSILLLAGLAPLVEELIFRGLLYGWLEGRWGWRVAFVVSSLAFAAAHFEPAHILLVLPLGFLFGWLRRQTKSLVPSLVSHVANNGFAVLSVAWLNS